MESDYPKAVQSSPCVWFAWSALRSWWSTRRKTTRYVGYERRCRSTDGPLVSPRNNPLNTLLTFQSHISRNDWWRLSLVQQKIVCLHAPIVGRSTISRHCLSLSHLWIHEAYPMLSFHQSPYSARICQERYQFQLSRFRLEAQYCQQLVLPNRGPIQSRIQRVNSVGKA